MSPKDLCFDVEALGRYIRLATDDETIKNLGVDHLCPRRRTTRGVTPILTSRVYNETRGKGPKESELARWEPSTTKPTNQRVLVGVAPYVGVVGLV